MSLARKPTVFVSSTCYDLMQIRSDIRSFFDENLGYDVLLSEYDTFPLDPYASTVDNCLRVVDERADIFVLIIGSRYGYITETGLSVTNMEYLRAKAKGIPIYTFVDKSILSFLKIWRNNRNASFDSVVDTSKLFEFVDSIRNEDSVWSFSFETSQEIIHTLKNQLAYLFHDSLSIKRKAMSLPSSKRVHSLRGKSYQIAILRPDFWEYKLFAQILADNLAELADKKRDFRYGITFQPMQHLDSIEQALEYIPQQSSQLSHSIEMLNILLKKSFSEAIGIPGVEGDFDHIIYVAKRITDVYSSIIDWSLEFQALDVNDDCKDIVTAFAKICEPPLNDIERFSEECCQKLFALPDKCDPDAEIEPINIMLKITAPDMQEFHKAINNVRIKYGLQPEPYEG